MSIKLLLPILNGWKFLFCLEFVVDSIPDLGFNQGFVLGKSK